MSRPRVLGVQRHPMLHEITYFQVLATNFKMFSHRAVQTKHQHMTSDVEYLSKSIPGLDLSYINPGREVSAATSAFHLATTF